jgi:hypothetical protein
MFDNPMLGKMNLSEVPTISRHVKNQHCTVAIRVEVVAYAARVCVPAIRTREPRMPQPRRNTREPRMLQSGHELHRGRAAFNDQVLAIGRQRTKLLDVAVEPADFDFVDLRGSTDSEDQLPLIAGLVAVTCH